MSLPVNCSFISLCGVDIMKPWMGDVETGANVQRSIFLGDQAKGPFTAHVGYFTIKLKF